jgi:hypothetical protein
MAHVSAKFAGERVDPAELMPERYRPAGRAAARTAEPSGMEAAYGWAILGRGLREFAEDD